MRRPYFCTILLVVALLGCQQQKAAIAPSTRPAAVLATAPATRAVAPSIGQVADARSMVTYLASDELEGRGVGTAGLDRAADYIAGQFAAAGLRPLPGQSDFFQRFKITAASDVAAGTTLASGERTWTVRKDFIPLSFSAEGAFAGGVVFAGYGITSEKQKYDDYAGLDVKGKIVLVMRFEPHDAAGKSRFTGDEWSSEAHLTTKARNAIEHGAAGLLLVTPPDHHTDEGLMPFARAMGGARKIPCIQVKASVADELLKRGGAPDLATLQDRIDSTNKPASFALAGVEVKGDVKIDRKTAAVKNIVGYLPGTGTRANEYVVVGAHYDHLGYGGMYSLSPTTRAIHHGADDNASGTTAIVQTAARLAARPPERSVIFIAFTAEEEGILGSEHFVDHPLVPLSDVIAMINLDMVGRIRPEKPATHPSAAPAMRPLRDVLYVGGTGTAETFEKIVERADTASPLAIKDAGKGGLGPSDHMAFGLKKIPVLFLFSGLHTDYHRPTDTADKINYQGIDEVVDFTIRLVREVAAMPRQQYVAKFDSQSMRAGSPGMRRVSLGIIPDYSGGMDMTGGVKISGATPGSPAASAGLQEGDIVVKLGGTNIDTLQDLSDALATAEPGKKVALKYRRGEKVIETQIMLTERK